MKEEVYFGIFLNTLCYYAVISLVSYIIWRLFKHRKFTLALIFIFFTVFAEMVVYRLGVLPNVVIPRNDIKFEEKIKPFSFPPERKERVFIDLRFRYFCPALLGEYTALDTTTLWYFSNNQFIHTDVEKLFNNILYGEFIFDSLDRITFSEFIKVAKKEYNTWNVQKRRAYLNISEVLLEAILADALRKMSNKSLFILLSERYRLLLDLRLAIYDGYYYLDNISNWRGSNNIFSLWEKLYKEAIDLPDTNNKEVLLKGIILYHIYNHKNTPLLNWIFRLSARYRFVNTNTFVIFKDYLRLLRLYDPASFFSKGYEYEKKKMVRIRDKLKKDFAIGSGLIQFYRYINLMDKQEYFKNLEKANVSSQILYINSRDKKPIGVEERYDLVDNNPSKEVFSYNVLKYTPNYLKIRYKTDREGYIYFSDTYDKYWQAKLDGVNIPLYRANGVFKAVKVPLGSHILEFIYRPLFFEVSLYIYYGVIILSLLFFIYKWSKRYILHKK